MKSFTTDQIRNVALFGHQGAGKTMLTESMLLCMGETNRIGSVEEGTTVSDYSPEEIDRNNSIQTSVMHGAWKNYKINILDLPGFADFAGEWTGAATVVDTALIVISTVGGIEVGTERSWSQAVLKNLPRFFLVSKIDRENASYSNIVDRLQERFGPRAVPLYWPIGEGPGNRGVVNILTGQSYSFDDRGRPQKIDTPAELESVIETWKNRIVEAAAETDDALLEKFFDAGELTADEIHQGIKSGVLSGELFPILPSVGTTAMAACTILDAITDYAPSPSDRNEWIATEDGSDKKIVLKADPKAPFAAFVFKTVSEPHVGELSIFRVVSGTAHAGLDVSNTTRQTSERLGQLSILNGKNREDTAELVAGDIGATVKLKDTHTGNTLVEPKSKLMLPILVFPEPVMREAISPKVEGEDEKMAAGLHRLHEEDPSFRLEVDAEIHQTLLYGQGEMQLEILVAKLKRKFSSEIIREEPRIAYRETIRGKAEVHYKHKKQSGGRGQLGDVHIRVSPLPRGGGYEFVDSIVGGAIPGKFIPSVDKGIRESMDKGPLAGCKIVDVRVELHDGSYHSVDSSDLAFKIAGSMAFRDGILKATPVLLEPIYDVEVVVPEDFMGDIMGDLSSRRGKIQGMEAEGPFQKVKAQVPLSSLYKYSSDLRSMTQGRGHHTRMYSHYEEVPREIAAKIQAEVLKSKAEEK